MICAWTELLSMLPEWIRTSISHTDQFLQELRLRAGHTPELVPNKIPISFCRKVTSDDLHYCINAASRYSPWNASSIVHGYITGFGGHRIGICGTAFYKEGKLAGVRDVTSLCIRIARDISGVSNRIPLNAKSVLIVGAPGWGKTTLLRDLIRQRSNRGEHICVADERNELFPQGQFHPGRCTDVLTGCTKADGIEMLLRTMGPECIAVDEITANEDCHAILHAAYCGVNLIATAHASSLEEYYRREIYEPLRKANIFDTIIVLQRDKSWTMERSKNYCTNGSVQF